MDAARASAGIGPASSTGSPMTFMMRPRVPSPTGTAIGAPVSVTPCPRTSTLGRVHGDAADDVLAELLRHFEDEAVALVVVSSAFRISGR